MKEQLIKGEAIMQQAYNIIKCRKSLRKVEYRVSLSQILHKNEKILGAILAHNINEASQFMEQTLNSSVSGKWSTSGRIEASTSEEI